MATKDKKQKIIQAAFEMMGESGASFIKLNEVAKKAKVPAPLIHYYFENIEDLHYEVILKTLSHLRDYNLRGTNTQPNDSVLTLCNYIKGPFLWANQNPQYMSLWMYFYYLATYSEKFRDLSTQIRIQGRERISLMIYKGIENKQFSLQSNTSIAVIAEEIQAIITGLTILMATENTERNMEYYSELCTTRVMNILGAKV